MKSGTAAFFGSVGVSIALTLLFEINQPSLFAYFLLAVALGGLAMMTAYTLRTLRRFANRRADGQSTPLLQWILAGLAALINLYWLFILSGLAILILVGRPIVS